jgi:hypothetical protein
MNVKSNDDEYNGLVKVLRDKHKLLGGAIKPEVYYYGFLRS